MEARDFRSIGRAAQEELRRRALFLIEHEGMSQAEAARAVGVQRQAVNIWLKRYRDQGEDGILDGRRVSPRRGKGLLTEAEARQVRAWIADKTPDQLKLPFALWTSRAVRDLIALRFGKQLGLSTIQLYLRRWGLTPQKPLARAKERQPAAIQAWLDRDYPAIARRAKAEQAVIYWGDETGISNQDQIGRSWAPKGKTPVITRTAKRLSQSMISAVSNRGLMRFMFYDGALNVDRFIAFLRRLIKDAQQKVFLIVDNLKVHHAKKVTAWVANHAHEIALFYLPAYAPDHNPDEFLNNDLKQKLRQQPQPGSKDALIKATRAVLRAIQRSPERVRGYFKPAPVNYAA
jgi:transposase